jgi:hypothetical protein
MNKGVYLVILIGLIQGCTGKKTSTPATVRTKPVFNQALAGELAGMAQTDQIAAYIPQGKYKALSPAQWNAFKDSVFTMHQQRVEAIFNQYGYPGYNVAGKEGSHHFWLLVQHADHAPAFQQRVLEKMKVEVDRENAEPGEYALLVDRVRLNTGKQQVYGTQVTYNHQTGQAYPKPLADSTSVNERRKSVGLPPLEEYLNGMTQMHFEMNKEGYLKRGVKEPTLYKTGKAGEYHRPPTTTHD